MASRRSSKRDLNAPLRSLSDRLRSLQKEATQLLDAARLDSRRLGARDRDDETGGAREMQISRVAANFLERWDIPSRSDLDEIHQRLDRIEGALVALTARFPADEPPAGKPRARRTSKTRRRKSAGSD